MLGGWETGVFPAKITVAIDSNLLIVIFSGTDGNKFSKPTPKFPLPTCGVIPRQQ